MKDNLLISVIIEYGSYIALIKSDIGLECYPFKFPVASFNIKHQDIQNMVKKETGLDVKNIDEITSFSTKLGTVKYFKCETTDLEQLNKNNFVLFDRNLKPKVKINRVIENNLENLGYLWGQGFSIVKQNNSLGSSRFGVIKSEIDIKMKKKSDYGINTKIKRSPNIIISITSFPERMYDLHYTLHSVFNQSIKPDSIVLWLGIEQFPNLEKDIPVEVLKFRELGLTIKWCEDIKSFKKLIPSLKEYPKDIIVTMDDDMYYHNDCLKRLYESYEKNPQYVHCHRAHQIVVNKNGQLEPMSNWKKQKNGPDISYNNWFYGVSGVLYPPNTLSGKVFDKELFLKLCPTHDDVWFWAMAVLKGTKIMIVKDNLNIITNTNLKRALGETDELALNKINGVNDNNITQISNVLTHFNLHGKLK